MCEKYQNFNQSNQSNLSMLDILDIYHIQLIKLKMEIKKKRSLLKKNYETPVGLLSCVIAKVSPSQKFSRHFGN